MGQLRVAVAGGTGRTGKEIVRYLNAEEGITVVGVVARTLAGKSMSVVLPDLGRDIPIFGDFAELCAVHPPHILVDFTTPQAAKQHFYQCLERRIHPIIGTTGFRDDELAEFATACSRAQLGGAVIPNFSIGALAMRQAVHAVAGLMQDVALLESYPRSKQEIPSGTSQRLASLLTAHRPELRREIPIHSVRLDGVLPQQEVRFGGEGETIVISHLVSDRGCFGRGVALAIKNIPRFTALVQDLEYLI
ncbi:MAG: 4-hydroxy-tetrahydrodipicolinate reductase [Limnochordia bacterium]|jgi:4-hydroxy-tetrahydrodipicolinate reductase